jgi:uncharacterized membrane-anchored protein YitT (DUF2179 family)
VERRERWRRAGRVALDYVLIAIGSVLVALAADLFLIPNRVVSGGVVGIATILHYLAGTRVGLVTLLINIPLFVAALVWGGGWRTGVRTVFGVAVMSLAIDLLQPYLPHVTTDPLLYTLYGGLLDGLGVGLVLRAGGTTGGTDIVASVLYRLRGTRLGATILATNVLILGAAALIFGLEPALYALLVVYVSTQVVDLVQQGLARTRSCLIVSQRYEPIRDAILAQLERGVTVLRGMGGYTGEERPVLLCAVSQSEVTRLKRLVQELDPEAFVIVTAASEVLGKGFGNLIGR